MEFLTELLSESNELKQVPSIVEQNAINWKELSKHQSDSKKKDTVDKFLIWETAPEEIKQVGRANSFKNGNVYYVEKLLQKRISFSGTLYYFVKWFDWDNSFNSWEPKENLKGSEAAIAVFENSQKVIIDYLNDPASPPRGTVTNKSTVKASSCKVISRARPCIKRNLNKTFEKALSSGSKADRTEALQSKRSSPRNKKGSLPMRIYENCTEEEYTELKRDYQHTVSKFKKHAVFVDKDTPLWNMMDKLSVKVIQTDLVGKIPIQIHGFPVAHNGVQCVTLAWENKLIETVYFAEAKNCWPERMLQLLGKCPPGTVPSR